MFGFFKKEIHEPIEIQREDVMKFEEPIRSEILNGEDCDKIEEAYGEFGSITNPIPVNEVIGEIKYLGKLRAVTYPWPLSSISITNLQSTIHSHLLSL